MNKATFTNVSQIIGVLSRRGFSPQAVQLYLLLRDLSDDEGKISFTFSDFGDFTCRCKRSFQTCLKELYDGKLVSRVGQRSLWVHEIPPLSEQEQIEVITEAGAFLRKMLFAAGATLAPSGDGDNVYYVRFEHKNDKRRSCGNLRTEPETKTRNLQTVNQTK